MPETVLGARDIGSKQNTVSLASRCEEMDSKKQWKEYKICYVRLAYEEK